MKNIYLQLHNPCVVAAKTASSCPLEWTAHTQGAFPLVYDTSTDGEVDLLVLGVPKSKSKNKIGFTVSLKIMFDPLRIGAFSFSFFSFLLSSFCFPVIFCFLELAGSLEISTFVNSSLKI